MRYLLLLFLLIPQLVLAADFGCGRDTDLNGSIDNLCSGDDQDWDGFEDVLDCAPTNPKIHGGSLTYPGIPITTGCAAGSYRTCGPSGGYGSCILLPTNQATCGEKTGSGRCFFINPTSGNNSNDGLTTATAWADWSKISYYSGSGDAPPAGNVAQVEGDVIYLMNGTHTQKHLEINGGSSSQYGLLINTDNIKVLAYPGHAPVLAPVVHASQETNVIYADGADELLIEGLIVTNGFGSGFNIHNSSDVEIRNNYIHDIDGCPNNNNAGIYLHTTPRVNVHNNFVKYTTRLSLTTRPACTSGNTDNSSNIVLFHTDEARIHHNHLQQPGPNAANFGGQAGGGTCLKEKKHYPDDSTEIDHNQMTGCKHWAMKVLGTSEVHHNLVLDSNYFFIFKYDDQAYPTGLHFYNNTARGILGGVLEYDPDRHWATTPPYDPCGGSEDCNTSFPMGTLLVENNVFTESNPTGWGSDSGFFRIHNYGLDGTYTASWGAGKIQFADNCYFQTNGVALALDVFAASSAGATLGTMYNFTTWKAAGQDASTVNASVATPLLFNAIHNIVTGNANSDACAALDAGFLAIGGPIPTTTTLTTTTTTTLSTTTTSTAPTTTTVSTTTTSTLPGPYVPTPNAEFVLSIQGSAR